MIRKILLPLFGTSGIVYGVVDSFSKDQESALLQNSRKWEMKERNIGAQLSCSSSEQGLSNSVLSWEISLTEDELERIHNKETVNKEVDFKLVSKNETILWPKDWTGVRVHPSQLGSSLSVNYTKAKGDGKEPTKQLIISKGNYEIGKIVCAWEGLKKMDETEIYRSGMQLGREELFADSQSKKLSLNISLGECTKLESGRETQCSLKVTTNGADLDWSSKVSSQKLLILS